MDNERLKEIEELASAATEGLLKLANTPMQMSLAEWQPVCGPIRGASEAITELVAEIRRLREALQFYADKKHIGWVPEDGQRARDAIGGQND